jgi:hypothetical protein
MKCRRHEAKQAVFQRQRKKTALLLAASRASLGLHHIDAGLHASIKVK